jgi:hypothetical protein
LVLLSLPPNSSVQSEALLAFAPPLLLLVMLSACLILAYASAVLTVSGGRTRGRKGGKMRQQQPHDLVGHVVLEDAVQVLLCLLCWPGWAGQDTHTYTHCSTLQAAPATTAAASTPCATHTQAPQPHLLLCLQTLVGTG